jgi:hypothetical protein
MLGIRALMAASGGATETEVAVDRTAGTAIGTLTEVGGLAAAFDGTIYKLSSSSARGTDASAPVDGYIGKDWGSGVTKKISEFSMSCQTDSTFGGTSPSLTVTFKLQGSTDNFSSSIVELSSDTINNNAYSQTFTIPEADIVTTTAYRYHRVFISHGTPDRVYVSQVQFKELV